MPPTVSSPSNDHSNSQQQLIKSLSGVCVMYVVATLAGLAINMVLARTLGPEVFGQYTYIIVMVSLLTLPLAGGLSIMLIREVAAYMHAEQWPLFRGALRAAHLWIIIGFLVLLILYALLGPVLHWIPGEGKWALLGFGLWLALLQALLEVRKSATKGVGYPALAELPTQLVQPVVMLLAIAGLFWLDSINIHNILWLHLGVAVMTVIIAGRLFTRLRPPAVQSATAQYRVALWMSPAVRFTLIGIVGAASNLAGIVILGILSNDAAVADYRIGTQSADLVGLPLMLVNLIIAPRVVTLFQSGDIASLQQLAQQTARGAFLLSLLFGITLIIFGKPIIGFAFGEAYIATAYLPMVILVIGQLINTAAGSVGLLLSMCRQEKLTLYGHMVGLSCNVIFALIFIPLWQSNGAAIAMALAMVVWNAVLIYAVVKRLELWPAAMSMPGKYGR